jgi:hypothetical protein
MKCRACWTDKAYKREVTGWRATAYAWLGLVPLKCHHCYHKFTVPWFLTIGKRLTAPALKVQPAAATLSMHSRVARASEIDEHSSSSGMRRAA